MPQKFWTTKDRYVDGKYIRADPEHPKLVEFPDHLKVKMRADGKTPEDGSLKPYVEKVAAPTERQERPFAEIRRGPKDRPSHERDRAEGRPSDSDPAGR